MVLAFSMTGGFIPAGSGTLVELDTFTVAGLGPESCFDFVFSGAAGAKLGACPPNSDHDDVECHPVMCELHCKPVFFAFG